MDFSKKLSRVAAASTWVGIVLAVIGAIVLHHHPAPGVHVHLHADVDTPVTVVVVAEE